MTTTKTAPQKRERLTVEDFIKSKFTEEMKITKDTKNPDASIVTDVKNFGKINIFVKDVDIDKYLEGRAIKYSELKAKEEVSKDADKQILMSKKEKTVLRFLEENKEFFKESQLENLRVFSCKFNLKKVIKDIDGVETEFNYRNINVGKIYKNHLLVRVPIGKSTKEFNDMMNSLKGVLHSYISFRMVKGKKETDIPKKYGFRFFVLDIAEINKD